MEFPRARFSGMTSYFGKAMAVTLFMISAGLLTGSVYGCPSGYGLNYTLPMFGTCKLQSVNGTPVQFIPKLIRPNHAFASCGRERTYSGIRVCRAPDCLRNPCENGWCEETTSSYVCRSYEDSSGPQHANETSDRVGSSVTPMPEVSLTSNSTTKPTHTTNSLPVDPPERINHNASAYDSVEYLDVVPGNDSAIYSPNYPGIYGNNINTLILANAPAGYQIRASIVDFSLEARYDVLEIGYGFDVGGNNTTIVKLSCNFHPSDVKLQSRFMWFRFTTDHSVGDRGFRLTLSAVETKVCTDEDVNGDFMIVSPRPPPEYEAKSYFMGFWYIRSPVGGRVVASFRSFSLNGSSKEAVRVWSGYHDNESDFDQESSDMSDVQVSPDIQVLTGFYLPTDIVSLHEVLRVTFFDEHENVTDDVSSRFWIDVGVLQEAELFTGANRTAVVCQGTTQRIHCPAAEMPVLHIISAGARADDALSFCGDSPTASSPPAHCSSYPDRNTTSAVVLDCEGEPECVLTAADQLNSACLGGSHYMEVRFTCTEQTP